MTADSGSYDDATLQRRAAMAQAMMGQRQKPITHWAEGLSELGNGFLGGYQLAQLDKERKAEKTAEKNELYTAAGLPAPAAPAASPSGFQKIASLLSGGGADAPASPAAPAAMPSAPMSAPPAAPSVSGKIYSNDEPSPLDPPSGQDRMRMMATILGESANQPAAGQNAVASVIRNRAVAGNYGGDTPSGVVTAKNQFEPWNTEGGRSKMAAMMTNPALAAKADQAIALAYGEGGQAPNDPTNGAKNFIEPKLQTALGRPMPAWAQGPGQMIGDHKFIGGAPQDPSQQPYQVAGPSTAAPQAPVAQAMTPPQMPPTGMFANVPKEQLPGILSGLTSKNPTLKAIAVQQLGTFNKPPEYGFQTLPDGTIVRTDPRKGTVEPTYTAPTKQTFGVIGEEDGKKTYGFIDPAKGTVKPLEAAKPGDERPTVTGPDGKEIVIPKGVDVPTFRKEISKINADAAGGKMTEVQAKATSFANRMESAEANLAKGLEKEASGIAGAAQQVAGGVPVVGSAMQSSQYQKFAQAKSQFITAMLRQESGAAINKDEFNRYDKEFFPQPGDKPEVIAQKAEQRKVAIDAMKKGAGPSYKSPQPSAASRTTKSVGGKNYYQENGQWFEE